MIVGYALVETLDPSLDLQRDALDEAGCTRMFDDRIGRATADHPAWREAKAALRSGGTLDVRRLCNLGLSLTHLIEVITELDEHAIGFKGVLESLDTTTPGGRLAFHVFGALAPLERVWVQERTKAGLDAARARGRMGAGPGSWARRRSPRPGACWRIPSSR